MNQFQVNEFITLKLEDGKTNIYVDKVLFEQCKFLLLTIPIKEISYFEEIDSVDEAAENLSKLMERKKAQEIKIAPEAEFWAHCSNLQVWSEYNYDTRLIHSNLAFPLLKRLTEVGDPIAKRVFKEEIAKRLESGYWPVIKFLMEENYTDHLSREEFLNSILGVDTQGQKESSFLLQLEELIGSKFDLEQDYDPEYNNFSVENHHIRELSIYTNSDIDKVLPMIGDLCYLKVLFILCKNLINLPNSIGKLKNLELLHVSNNEIQTLTETIENLKNLKELNLSRNKFTEFPKIISSMKSLEELDLSGNSIRSIPKEIENLRNLKTLWLNRNKIKKLPETMINLKNLDYLELSHNNLEELPLFVKDLPNLKFLNIFNNNLKESTKFIQKIKKGDLKINY